MSRNISKRGELQTGSYAMPSKFLDHRVHDLSFDPGLSGLCAGYEMGKWRGSQLAKHVLEWLPEFALSANELRNMNPGNTVSLLRRAAKSVYTTNKFQRRGEFGELLLHIAIRQVFGSVPAISKIYYKSANNETVKGFDAVHVVETDDGLELWLGEAKFYADIGDAISAAVEEIEEHTERDYLRNEFLFIDNKIDANWEHADELRSLISGNTSIDEIFRRVCIPVLLTYDSETVSNFTDICDEYCEAFESEVREHHQSFCSNALPPELRFHLFLLPIESKVELVKLLHKELETWRNI